jgi:hypothetical protein
LGIPTAIALWADSVTAPQVKITRANYSFSARFIPPGASQEQEVASTNGEPLSILLRRVVEPFILDASGQRMVLPITITSLGAQAQGMGFTAELEATVPAISVLGRSDVEFIPLVDEDSTCEAVADSLTFPVAGGPSHVPVTAPPAVPQGPGPASQVWCLIAAFRGPGAVTSTVVVEADTTIGTGQPRTAQQSQTVLVNPRLPADDDASYVLTITPQPSGGG